MQRRYLTVLSLTALLLSGAALAAGAGKTKEEKSKGEIVSVEADRLQLKTKKGTVTVLLTQKPKIVMGGAEMSPGALKQGVKVTVVGAAQPTGEIVAREIRLPAPVAPIPLTMPSGHSGHAH